MRKAWLEFKEFALGGNMLDLALGFIIGAAFATVVESLAKNIITDFISALGGAPDTSSLVLHIRKGQVHYGTFLGDFLGFLILGLVLFLLVKAIKRMGLGDFKAQGQKECPYCKEFISVAALTCKWCTQVLVENLPSPGEADHMEQRDRTEAH